MKVTVNVECTPEEARTFLGLPDVQPNPAPQKVTVRVGIGPCRRKLPCMLVEAVYD